MLSYTGKFSYRNKSVLTDIPVKRSIYQAILVSVKSGQALVMNTAHKLLAADAKN
jgi:hypothetical protein